MTKKRAQKRSSQGFSILGMLEKCQTTDRNQISKIYEDSWRYAYRGIIPQGYLDKIPKGHWSKNFDIPYWNTVVCIYDGKYIGTSSFCESRFENYKNLGEIISIYLLPEYIGLGYGKKLLDFVIAQLKEKGYNEVFLWVLEENCKCQPKNGPPL